jgi:ANTAR domain
MNRRPAMTMCGEPVPDAGAALRSSVPEAALAMRGLRPSAEPAVVLSSLARSCVPWFSDGCAVELSEGLDPVFRVSYPLPDDDAASEGGASPGGELRVTWAPDKVVTTAFEMPSGYGRPSCAGVLVHSWRLRIPVASDAIIARLLVDEALALVRHERLAGVAAEADRRAAQLALEAMTGKAIGEATGIIMATRNMTNLAAFDVLKSVSRHAGRNVYDIALEVARAGGLDHPTDVPAAQVRGGSSRRANLRSVRGDELCDITGCREDLGQVSAPRREMARRSQRSRQGRGSLYLLARATDGCSTAPR